MNTTTCAACDQSFSQDRMIHSESGVVCLTCDAVGGDSRPVHQARSAPRSFGARIFRVEVASLAGAALIVA